MDLKPADQQPPTTMQALAKRLGLSLSTVSKALAGDPKIAVATRERVRQGALATGYQPNQPASLLARQRNSNLSGSSVLNIAILGLWHVFDFAEACKEAGVHGEEIHLQASDNPSRVLDILWNRGVSGLLLVPERMPSEHVIEPAWTSARR